MKKILLILSILILSLTAYSQAPGIFTFVIVRDSLCIGDSCVTVIMNDTLVNPEWVRAYVIANAGLPGGSPNDIQVNVAGSFGSVTNLTTDNLFMDNYYNTNLGLNGLPSITVGYQNTNTGGFAGVAMTTAINNTSNGYNSLSSVVSDTGNIALGTYAGKYWDNGNYRIFINSLDRGSKIGDTTKSPIYIRQSATIANQDIYLNGNIKTETLTVGGGVEIDSTRTIKDAVEDTDFDTLHTGVVEIASKGFIKNDFNYIYIHPKTYGSSSGVYLGTDEVDGVLSEDFVCQFDNFNFRDNNLTNILLWDAEHNNWIFNAGAVIDDDTLLVLNGSDTLMKVTPSLTKIGTNLEINGWVQTNHYEAAAYTHPDSTITTSLTTSWEFLGAGENNKFTNLYAEGFSFDGDTLQFDQRVDDLRDSIEFHIDYSCESATSSVNKTIYIGIFTKHTGGSYIEQMQVTRKSRTATAGVYYPGPTCSTMPIWLKDGDKIQIRAKCGATTTTLSSQGFGIYLREE